MYCPHGPGNTSEAGLLKEIIAMYAPHKKSIFWGMLGTTAIARGFWRLL